ncbi:MAG: MBL fold metallo-hydrolase [Lysobacterales bacterium]|jgi:glyoxylase-like metal-dependent hydrolase (beta-lactamase superfamily II)
MKPTVKAFFDQPTNTVTYVVSDPGSGACAIIDPVLDFDQASGRTSTASADEVLGHVLDNGYEVAWILETHAHADHLTAASYLKAKTGAQTGIGRHITKTQAIFKEVFNLEDGFRTDGTQFDRLFDDGDTFELGALQIRVLHTPGHTPACVTYLAGDAAFVGDTLFMPDYGTARVDFPGGDAATLYRSIRRIFELPLTTRLFMCHDYKAPDRDEYAWETTVAAQREGNVHIRDGVSEAEFIEFRTGRDAKLGMPKLILPSIQVNIRAGEMPPADDNGVVYLKMPVDAL